MPFGAVRPDLDVPFYQYINVGNEDGQEWVERREKLNFAFHLLMCCDLYFSELCLEHMIEGSLQLS